MKACNQLCPWNTLYGCIKPESEPCILSNMPCESFELKPKTNADHIRSMSDEELAEFLDDNNSQGCVCPTKDCEASCAQCITNWLKQPYKEAQ